MKILSEKTRPTTSQILFILFGLALCGATVQAQDSRQQLPSGPTARPAGQSVITGRVVFDDSGQPVAKVRVQLIPTRRAESGPPIAPQLAVANDQGEFRFNGVAAGEYSVVAQLDPRISGAQSYSTTGIPAGAANPTQPQQGITKVSVDGRTNAEVELRVPNPHFGIISGYVLRPGGDVAVNSRVTIASSNTQTRFTLSATTDDRGAYRFERIPAGEYLLSADPPRSQNEAGVGLSSFVPTYYSSTANVANATPITVAADVETPGINITLIERSVHRVSGTVKFRSGEPVPRVPVQLVPKTTNMTPAPTDPQSLMGRAAQIQITDENGGWSFSNIPDGDYELRVDSRQVGPARNSPNDPGQPRPPAPKFTAKQQPVTVAGMDLNDLAVLVSAGGRISGSVVVEGERPLPPNVSIMAGGENAREFRPVSATIQADGSFTLTGVPEGDVWIVPQLRPANTFYVKAIEANGLNLTRVPLKLEDGADIKNVRVVISSGVGIVTGRVVSATGNAPPSRTAVVLVPVDAEQQKFSGSRFTSLSQADGTFTVGAAPGDYIVLTFRTSEQPRFDPETLAKSQVRISLKAGERKTLEIVK